MSENKPEKTAKNSKKEEIAVKTTKPVKPVKRTMALAPAKPLDLWQAFDDTFERFRSDFEDLLFPAKWSEALSLIPQTRIPAIDLEDHEREYLLKAEMPGFKKGDIEIEVQDNTVSITGYAGWKYDKKGKLYICKERACETFYRTIELPEEIKTDDVTASLAEGVLEMTLPKKRVKPKRKVIIK